MLLTKLHLIGLCGCVEKEKTILKITFWTVPSMNETLFNKCFVIVTASLTWLPTLSLSHKDKKPTCSAFGIRFDLKLFTFGLVYVLRIFLLKMKNPSLRYKTIN